MYLFVFSPLISKSFCFILLKEPHAYAWIEVVWLSQYVYLNLFFFFTLLIILCYSKVDCLDVGNYNEIYVSRTPSEMRL